MKVALIGVASGQGGLGNAFALAQQGARLFKPQAMQPSLGRQPRSAPERPREALAPQACAPGKRGNRRTICVGRIGRSREQPPRSARGAEQRCRGGLAVVRARGFHSGKAAVAGLKLRKPRGKGLIRCFCIAAKSFNGGKPQTKKRRVAHHVFYYRIRIDEAQRPADILRKPRGVKVGHMITAGLIVQGVATVRQAWGNKHNISLEGRVRLPQERKARAALKDKPERKGRMKVLGIGLGAFKGCAHFKVGKPARCGKGLPYGRKAGGHGRQFCRTS